MSFLQKVGTVSYFYSKSNGHIRQVGYSVFFVLFFYFMTVLLVSFKIFEFLIRYCKVYTHTKKQKKTEQNKTEKVSATSCKFLYTIHIQKTVRTCKREKN